MVQNPAVAASRPRNRKLGRICTVMLAGLLTAGLVGCPEPPFNILVDSNGNPIRIDQITTITSDTTTTTAEKRQALRDLGITDESLIDILLK